MTTEQLQSPAGLVAARRYDVVFQNPGRPLDATVTIDSHARLVRVESPARACASSVPSSRVLPSVLSRSGIQTIPM